MSITELRRVLAEHLTQQKLGLYWERNAIDHDKALNANVVLPRLVPEWSHTPDACTQHQNLIIEGDNFDSLRLLRSTHAGRIRVAVSVDFTSGTTTELRAMAYPLSALQQLTRNAVMHRTYPKNRS